MAVTASLVKLGFILAATDRMTAVIGSAVKQSTAKLNAFEKRVNSINANFLKAGSIMTTAGVGIFEGMFKLAGNTADYGNELYKASQKIGMGFDEYQKLAYAAKQAGVEQSELASVMVSFNRTVVSAFSGGNKEVADGLRSLGISIRDASGKMRKQEDILKDIAGVFSRAEDSAGKMTVATKLFGKSGANLIPMLNGGVEGLAEMAAELEELGLLTEQQGQESVAFSDALTRLTTSFTGLKNEIGLALMPKLTELIEYAKEISLTVRDWIKENTGLVNTVARAALKVSGFLIVTGVLATSVGIITSIFGKFITVFKGLITVVKFANAAFIAIKNSMILFKIQYYALEVQQRACTAAQWLYNAAINAVNFGKYIAQLALMKAKQIALTVATKVAVAAQWLWNAAINAVDFGKYIAQLALMKAKQLALTIATKVAAAAQWLWNAAINAVDFGKYIAQLALMKAKQLVLTVATKVAAAAQWLWNAAMSANPIGLIILAVVALAAAVYLIIKNWDKVKEFFVKLWESVKPIFTAVWEWIKNLFLNYTPYGLIIKHWDKIVEWFSGLWSRVKAVFAALNPIEWLTKTFAKVKGWFANFNQMFFNFGKNLITGLINGIKAMIMKPAEIITDLGKSVKDAFTGFLGIKSPSTVFAEFGVNITKGLSLGIERGSPDTSMAAEGLALQAMRGVSNTDVVNTSSVGGVTVNYSPTVNVTNGGGTQDILAALRQHKAEFIRWIDEAQQNRRRLAFAD